MTNDSETVREVCADFKKHEHTCRKCDFTVCPSINLFAGRVIASYEREMAAKDDMARIAAQSAQARFDEELAAKDAEIARLNDELFAYAGGHVITGSERYLKEKNRQLESRIALLERALKPVMECDIGSPNQMAAWGAVREAQRIMKEGGEK